MSWYQATFESRVTPSSCDPVENEVIPSSSLPDFTGSLIRLIADFQRKVEQFAQDVNAMRLAAQDGRELSELFRRNVREFKQRIETFGETVQSAVEEEARVANPLVAAFNQLVNDQIRRTASFAAELDREMGENVSAQQAPDLIAFDALIAQFRQLVTNFGNDLAAQAPGLSLSEREQLLNSFEDLIKSFEDLLRSRLELTKLAVEVSNTARFGALQKNEELLKSVEDLLKSIEDLINSSIDLVFKPVQKIEELIKSIEDLLKSFEDLAKSSNELAFMPIQKTEELLKSLEELIRSFRQLV